MWHVEYVNPPRSREGEPESFQFYPVPEDEVQRCLLKVIPVTERVAQAAKADHVRVDVLVRGECEDIYVSECDVFPGCPLPFKIRQLLRDRWLYGYGIQSTPIHQYITQTKVRDNVEAHVDDSKQKAAFSAYKKRMS